MGIYEQNMKVLEEYHISLYKALKEKEKEVTEKTLTIVEKTALNGEPILEIEKNGHVYRLNSIYNPSHEAQVWSEQFKGQNLQNVFVIFGFGNGYFIRALKEHISDRRVFVIYEPSYEIFRFAIKHYDFTDLFKDPDIGLVVRNVNEADFMDVLANVVHWNNVNEQISCVINQYSKIFTLEYKVYMNRILENNNNVYSNWNTAIYFGKTDFYNTIENSIFLYESNNITEMIGKIPENIPVIVVAAGPSLEKNIDQIKKAKGKAIIIGVDRALDLLLKHGIMPDFSVTVDPDKPPRFYDNPVTWEIPLFFPLSANRKILCRHTGRKILFNYNPISSEYFKRLDQTVIFQSPGGSVATAAVSIAITLQIRNVILVGQDLAYENGITHAGGVRLEDSVTQKQLVKVKGIHGEDLYTGWDMYNYILWYQQTIQNCKDDVQIIDATEGGALIRGTKIMTLEDAIQTYCTNPFDVQELLESIRIRDLEERYQINLELLKDTIEDLKDFKAMSDKAQKLCEELLKNINKYHGLSTKGKKLSLQLAEMNLNMRDNFIAMLVEDYVFDKSSSIISDINVLGEDDVVNDRKTFETSRDLYAMNKKACDDIIAYLEPVTMKFDKK